MFLYEVTWLMLHNPALCQFVCTESGHNFKCQIIVLTGAENVENVICKWTPENI